MTYGRWFIPRLSAVGLGSTFENKISIWWRRPLNIRSLHYAHLSNRCQAGICHVLSDPCAEFPVHGFHKCSNVMFFSIIPEWRGGEDDKTIISHIWQWFPTVQIVGIPISTGRNSHHLIQAITRTFRGLSYSELFQFDMFQFRKTPKAPNTELIHQR